MALAEGIRIHQYMDVWPIRADLKPQCQVNNHWLVSSCRKPGLDDKFQKIRFIFQLKKANFGLQIRPQGRASFPNSKELDCLLEKTVTMLKLLTHLQGSSYHFESMASMEKTIPLG